MCDDVGSEKCENCLIKQLFTTNFINAMTFPFQQLSKYLALYHILNVSQTRGSSLIILHKIEEGLK